jgi:hypothetical protein
MESARRLVQIHAGDTKKQLSELWRTPDVHRAGLIRII